MKGVFNKLYVIDVSAQQVSELSVPDDDFVRYLGGRGLAVRLFTRRVDAAVDPLSPDNELLFVTGPLTATEAPASGRLSLVTKSPLTGAISFCNIGGGFGYALKQCGVDGFILKGASEKPVYVVIDGAGGVSVKPADVLWGKNTQESVSTIKELEGVDCQFVQIGQAGENQVKMASVVVDEGGVCGRGGVGAVMGAKNVKAVVVKNGRQQVCVHNEGLLQQYVRQGLDKIKVTPVTRSALPRFGTAAMVNVVHSLGMLPLRNFSRGHHEGVRQISGEAIRSQLLEHEEGCRNCSIACGRRTKAGDMAGAGPEFETVWALGANCDIYDLVQVAQAGYYCNLYGLDPISVGGTIACAMELQEQGLLPGAPGLHFGHADVLSETVRMIAFREGLGEQLAEGSRSLAEAYGRPEVAMHVKGLELPAYDPRGAMGQALGFATGNSGACHHTGFMAAMELFAAPKRVPRFTSEGKADLLVLKQHQAAVEDSLVGCPAYGFAIGPDFLARFLTAVTGVQFDVSSLMKAGERIYNLERLFNVKAGLTRKQDTLPDRFLNTPLKEGLSKDKIVPLTEMLDTYYDIRGWDQYGVPRATKLQELGIETK